MFVIHYLLHGPRYAALRQNLLSAAAHLLKKNEKVKPKMAGMEAFLDDSFRSVRSCFGRQSQSFRDQNGKYSREASSHDKGR